MSGPRVGLLEGRMSDELAELVRRHGGEPVVAPALSEVPVDASADVAALIDALEARRVTVMVFLTGAGVTALLAEADRLGRRDALERALRETVNVCRGHKPWAPLRRIGAPVSVTVPEPYTTDDVLRTLRGLTLRGAGVALMHYGERSAALAEALCAMGAEVRELCLYQWRLPEDLAPLERLVCEVVRGGVDAVAFTSQVQVRHLLHVAYGLGMGERLREAMDSRVVVAAVGPTCAAALAAAGITPAVVPSNPKMGPMVVALMRRLRQSRAA